MQPSFLIGYEYNAKLSDGNQKCPILKDHSIFRRNQLRFCPASEHKISGLPKLGNVYIPLSRLFSLSIINLCAVSNIYNIACLIFLDCYSVMVIEGFSFFSFPIYYFLYFFYLSFTLLLIFSSFLLLLFSYISIFLLNFLIFSSFSHSFLLLLSFSSFHFFIVFTFYFFFFKCLSPFCFLRIYSSFFTRLLLLLFLYFFCLFFFFFHLIPIFF